MIMHDNDEVNKKDKITSVKLVRHGHVSEMVGASETNQLGRPYQVRQCESVLACICIFALCIPRTSCQ